MAEIDALFHVSGDVPRSQLASDVASNTKYHSGAVALVWILKISGNNVDAFEQLRQTLQSINIEGASNTYCIGLALIFTCSVIYSFLIKLSKSDNLSFMMAKPLVTPHLVLQFFY